MTKILITGGAGFIGSHLVDYFLKQTDWSVEVWDYLGYASRNADRLEQIDAFKSERFRFVNLDLQGFVAPISTASFIAHLAAETHVETSITNPRPFINSNVIGTFNILQWARNRPLLEKFLYFSTDEVFGPGNSDWSEPFTEYSRYNSSNPYSATKAAGEELAVAWARTYGLPVVISHCCNVFGARQHPEKFIPKLVYAILGGHRIGIHSNENGTPGERMYVYVGDVCRAIHLLLEKGEPGAKYNIPGRRIDNEALATIVASILGKPITMDKVHPFKERPGWDFSYNIGGTELAKLGWKEGNFEQQLLKTVESYK